MADKIKFTELASSLTAASAGSGLVFLVSDAGVLKKISGLLFASGAVALTGNLPFGNHKATGLDDGTASGDAVHFGQIEARSGENLVPNSLLSSWSGGGSAVPDHWALAGTPSSIAKISDGLRVTEGATGNIWVAPLIDCTEFRGQELTVTTITKTSVANKLRMLRIYDVTNVSNLYLSAHHPGTGVDVKHTATVTVPSNATTLRLEVYSDGVGSGNTWEIRKGMRAVLGDITGVRREAPSDRLLHLVDYQNATPANLSYGGMRAQIGKANLAYSYAGGLTKVVTFPHAYRTVLGGWVTLDNNPVGFNISDPNSMDIDLTTTTMTINLRDEGSGFSSGDTVPVYWMAIGIKSV